MILTGIQGSTLYGIYSINTNGRLSVEINFGVFLAYMIFEEISTTGLNSHSALVMEDVVTDPFNYENISQVDAGLEFSLNLNYSVSKKLGIYAGAGMRQGLLPMENKSAEDYSYSIYQGQYNPQYYNSGSNSLSQLFPVRIGIRYSLTGNNKFDN